MILHILGWVLVLLSPLCIGLPWVKIGGAKGIVARICFAYVAGYFLRLTLFHFIALPMTILGMHFSTVSNAFTVALVIACGISIWFGRDALIIKKRQLLNLTVYERIYGIVCIGLILFQLYMCIVMDPTYMTYDDATYTVYSSDALATNYMFITSPQTGIYMQLDFRVIQSSLLFPAYITRMTGMPVTMVERTFSYALDILLAYGCYAYMAEDIFKKNENRLIFLIILSVIYIFGYHSHYSMTFRLLGPNQQGKAILAVTLVPMMFVLLRKSMSRTYEWKSGFFVFLLSDAACALSMMGTGYMLAITVLLTVLAILPKKNRKWKNVYYIFSAGLMPFAYLCSYVLLNNLV